MFLKLFQLLNTRFFKTSLKRVKKYLKFLERMYQVKKNILQITDIVIHICSNIISVT